MNNWVEVTFWLPVLVVPVFLLLLVLLAFLLLVIIRRNRRHVEKLEQALADAQRKMAGLEEREAEWQSATEAYQNFVYIVSHETANPLQSIQTNLDNLVASMPDGQMEWQSYHQVIVEEIRRLGRLTENLRILSHLEAKETATALQVVNLKAVIEEVIIARPDEAEQKGLTLLYVGPMAAFRVMGDREQLRQVFLNLVDNSIKYSRKAGGLITISADIGREIICMRVSDEGIGIDGEDLPYVFEAAYRSPHAWSYRRRGSGLGLHIAQRIVERHQGTIQVDSEFGAGTVITIELPAILAEHA